MALPVGDSLRVDSVGYYARLQVVDDWSTIPLYACLVVATIGLTITAVARQQIVLATVIDGPEGPRLAVTLRLWRNAPRVADRSRGSSPRRSATQRRTARPSGRERAS